jgi:hypothetical protein
VVDGFLDSEKVEHMQEAFEVEHWGQNAAVVARFLKENPDVLLDPHAPVCGRILVSVNNLTGVNRWNPTRWVTAQGLRPVAHVGYGHLLFSVPPEATGIPSVE